MSPRAKPRDSHGVTEDHPALPGLEGSSAGSSPGTCPGPGNHIPVGAVQDHSWEQLHFRDLGQDRCSCCTVQHQGGSQAKLGIKVWIEKATQPSVLVFGNMSTLGTKRHSPCLMQNLLQQELFHTIKSFCYTFSVIRYCYSKFFSRSYNKIV